jgi:hypothetical protein
MMKTVANCSTSYFLWVGSENNQSWPCATEQPHLSALISLHVSTSSHTYIIEQFSLDCTSHVCSSVVFLNNDDSTVNRKNQGTENAKFLLGKTFLYCRRRVQTTSHLKNTQRSYKNNVKEIIFVDVQSTFINL